MRQFMLKSHVVVADETGVNFNGKNHLRWTFPTNMATYIPINNSGDTKDLDQILPEGFENKTLVTNCGLYY